MKEFSLLIKPASADCNLRCDYCFYQKKCELYPDTRQHRMPDIVLEQIVKSYMATDQPIYSFGWQGGEPTLMGAPFFLKAVEFQKHYGQPGANVGNGLQTNATLIDAPMADLFARYKFLVGCSLDGPAEIHNRYRVNIMGRPSHGDVLQGIELLQKQGVEINILILVSRANVDKAKEVYRYLVDRGYHYHQYIPCVEFDERGELTTFSIDGEQWGEFLCGIFDAWYPRDIHTVSIRHYDSILMKMVGGMANVCTLGRDFRQYFVVEHNGDIYPCDFYVQEAFKLGNVMTTSWEEALNADLYRKFGMRKNQWNTACDRCPYLGVCSGDCLKHRGYAYHSPQTLSRLCPGWKRFFNHTCRHFQELAADIRQNELKVRRQAEANRSSVKPTVKRVGRNHPCPCGSGEKYKKCCGRY